MIYNKQTWNSGDVITAEKLNHIEDSVGSTGFCFVKTDAETGDNYCSLPGEDVITAAKAGKLMYLVNVSDNDVVYIMFLSAIQDNLALFESSGGAGIGIHSGTGYDPTLDFPF